MDMCRPGRGDAVRIHGSRLPDQNSVSSSEIVIAMKTVVWGLVVLLVILHHDVWLWDNDTLVGGFMPVTLLYHAGISLAAGITWYLATVFAWPTIIESDEASEEADA